MPETLLTLRTELKNRGFDYLTDARCDRMINDAYRWLVHRELWPFRATTWAGPPPLTVPSLGVIESVTVGTPPRVLRAEDRRTLVESGDLAATGAPIVFYVEDANKVKTFPVTSQSITVRHYRTPVPLVASGDVMIVPDQYR